MTNRAVQYYRHLKVSANPLFVCHIPAIQHYRSFHLTVRCKASWCSAMVKAKQPIKSKSKAKSDLRKTPEPRKVSGHGVAGPKKPVPVLSSPGVHCIECGSGVGDDSRALQCERCVDETWKCVKCLGISDELYDELSATSLHRFCTKCEDILFDCNDNND